MKEIARRFHCRLSGNGPEDQDLRLLPSPIYGYNSDQADVLDGALFAYVQGTDPEVILMCRGSAAGWTCPLEVRNYAPQLVWA
jgi:hypothetical protein